MKKAILLVLLALMAAMPTMAQNDLKFGYLSYATALQAMPDVLSVKRIQTSFNQAPQQFTKKNNKQKPRKTNEGG